MAAGFLWRRRIRLEIKHHHCERDTRGLESEREWSRRAVVRGGFAASAIAFLPGAESTPPKEKHSVPQAPLSALLILDYQVGVGDQPYAKLASIRAIAAVSAARNAGLLIIFSKVRFRPGYPDISPLNQSFASVKARNLLPPDASKLLSIFDPANGEITIDKNRFSAFSGNDLREVLRAAGITNLVMAGVATSGVILSTFTLAADEDYGIVILSDACADPKPALHQELMINLFPRSSKVLTVDEWVATLPEKKYLADPGSTGVDVHERKS